MAIFLPKNAFSVPVISSLFPSTSIQSFHHFKSIFLCLLLLMVGVNGFATDYYFSNNGNWSTLSNWKTSCGGNTTPASLPTQNDNVYICDDKSINVDVTNAVCNFLFGNLHNNPTLTISSGKSLTVYGNLEYNSGTNGGGIIVSGAGSSLTVMQDINYGRNGGVNFKIDFGSVVTVNRNFNIASLDANVTVNGTLNVGGTLTDGHTNQNGLGGNGTIKIGGNFIYNANNVWQSSNTINLEMTGCGQTIDINRDLSLAKFTQSSTCSIRYIVTHPSNSLIVTTYDQNCNRINLRPPGGDGGAGTGFSNALVQNASPCGPLITTTGSTTPFSTCSSYASSAQTFTVEGALLNNPLTVNSPSGYEVSTDGATYSASLTLSGGTIVTTTIYVRLVSGGSNGTYNGNITCVSSPATTQNIAVTGSISNTSALTKSTSSITGLNYNFGSGPSGAQTFNVAGSCLMGNINVTAPTNFEVSATNATANFANSITLASIGGTVWVRLAGNKNVSTYSGNISIINGTVGVTSPQKIAVNGTVSATPSALSLYFTNANANGKWSDLSNWRTLCDGGLQPASLPTRYDNVYICNDKSLTVDTNNAVCNDLHGDTNNSPSLIVSNGNSLTIFGDLDFNSGADGNGIQVSGSSSMMIFGNVYFGKNNGQDFNIASNCIVTVNGDFNIANKQEYVTVDGILIINGTLTDSHKNNYGLKGSGTVQLSGNFVYDGDTWVGSSLNLEMIGCVQNINLNKGITVAKLTQSTSCPTKYTVTNSSNILTTTIFDQNCNPINLRPTLGFSNTTAINSSCIKYYNSIKSGNWNDKSTWLVSIDNSTWLPATTIPTGTDGMVTILNGNIVTLTSSTGVKNLTVSNGTLDVSSYLLTGNGTLIVASNGKITVWNTNNFPTGFTSTTLSPGSTVNYNRTGDQTISGQTYSNLTLTGTGIKTTTGTTVNGVLSLEGSATTTGTAPIYGSGATLQYKGITVQTTGSEFSAGFSGTGGVILNNANGVTLNNAKTIKSLTLTNGKLNTNAFVLSVTNTSPTAISGGSVTSFINGSVSWSLPTISSAITYNFPVGKGITYLPFSLVNPTTTGATTIQVEAFNAGVGGNADGTTLNLLSNTEYWSWKTDANFTKGSVSLNTPLKVLNSLNAIGSSTTSKGTYSTLWGTPGTNGISNSIAVGGPNRFFVMATKTLPIQPPGLGYASAFAVFTEVGAISISGATVINGNLGTNSGAVTGLDYATISGSTHIADTYTLQAAADLTIAYNQFDKLGGTVLLNALGNGQVLMPGIYQTTNASTINGNLTLDALNDPNALFIIRIGGALAGADVKITLANSANMNNVYWQVNGAFSLAGSSIFSGNIIANGAIALAGNSTVLGNILTITGAITIDASGVKNDGLDHKYILIENNLISSAQTIHSGSTPTKLTGTLPIGGINYIYSWESSTTNGVSGFTPITINGNSQDFSPGVLTQTSWYRRIVTSGIYFNTSPAVMITVLEIAPPIIPPVLGTVAGFSIFTNTGEITNTGNSIITGNIGTNHSLHPITGFPPGIITGGSIHNADAVTSQATTDLNTANSYLSSLHGTVLNVTLGNGQVLTSGIWDTGGAATLNGELILDAQGDPNAIFIIICSGAVTSTQSSIKLVNSTAINNVYWYIKGAFTLAPNSVFKGTAIVTGAITLNSNSILLGSYLSTAGTILINNNFISNDNLLNRFIINGNWSNSNNWSTNVVPISSDNLNISALAKIDDDISCSNLTIDLNGSVTISPEKSLTLSGSITNNAGASGLIIKADPILANGSLIFHNKSTQPVNATVEMYSKASWDLSSALPAGSKYKWEFFGIPFRTLKASPAFDGAYVRRWNEKGNDTNYWLQLSNDSVLTQFTGYEVTQSAAKIYSFTGELINDNFPVNLSYTKGAYSVGQNIFCNPYTAAIDISKIKFGNNTENSIYFYNTGTYHDWNSSNTPLGDQAGQYNVSPTQLSGTGEIPGQIPSMQGFLVKATGPGGSITIPYTTVVKNTDKQRISHVIHPYSTDKVFTMIEIKGSRFSDRMWIFSTPECTPLFDNGWDGYKIKGSILAPQLYVAGIDGDYQVNAVKDMNETLLNFQKGEDSIYTLTFTHGNIPVLYSSVFLIDLLENKTIDVTANGSTYSFASEPTPEAVKRFKILTIPIEKDVQADNSKVKICSSANTLIVQNLSSLKGEMVIYDMMGRQLRKSVFNPLGVTTIQLEFITGAYVVKAATSNESVSQRIIIGKE